MAIKHIDGNIFNSKCQTLVNTVNCVGVMGKGLAKEYKNLYPDMFKSYQKYCETKDLDIGKLQLFKSNNKWILNFPTKKDWRKPSKLEYIEKGLEKFILHYNRLNISSIAFPMLGCGNGGLNWEDVKPVMEKYLKNLPIQVFIHLQVKEDLIPEHTKKDEISEWLKNEPEYLSSFEFLKDVKQKFSNLFDYTIEKLNRKIFVTINKENPENYVYHVSENENTICFDEDLLINIWKALRVNGVLNKNNLSSDIALNSDLIMFFLSELNYITLSELGEDKFKTIGVRILPHKQGNKSSTSESINFG